MQNLPATIFRQLEAVESLISAKDLRRALNELMGVEQPIRYAPQGKLAQHPVSLPQAVFLVKLHGGQWLFASWVKHRESKVGQVFLLPVQFAVAV